MRKFCREKNIYSIKHDIIGDQHLARKKLRLNAKGKNILELNFKDFFSKKWLTALPKRPDVLESNESFLVIRKKYYKNVIISYLNVNSIRNKFNDINMLLAKNLNVLCIAETKLDSSFPDNQFLLDGFKKPYRLDVNSRSAGLLLYVCEDLPFRLLNKINVPLDI